MKSEQIWTEAAKAYREFPLLDAKFIDVDTRAEVKRIFALILSQARLYESIKDHKDPVNEYSDTSPFLATMLTRLKEVETQLVQFEGKHGKLSTIPYSTIQA